MDSSSLPPTPASTSPGVSSSNPSVLSSLWEAVNLAWELGYLIALPVVVGGFGGAYLDKYAGTSPLFVITGFILALALSSIGIYRKIKHIHS